MAKRKKEEEVIIPETIEPATLDDLMGDRFGIYAKDVIQDRAIPDARDGMKPVQRRIIYAMYDTGNTIDKPTKKCAHIVGEVMGNYHPHGDSSIYDALVRMSQPWNVRNPLVDFQGNNGSIDGDSAAAYRYTEARLAAISQELVRDLDENTVDMVLTFDDSKKEPSVLPGRFPNLLVNGAKGIAVGIATEIPTHNLREVTDAIIYRINHPSCPIEKLMEFIPGPDFPTGGIIYKSKGIEDIYRTGRGRIEIASKYEIQENDGVKQIIVTEIPYQVVKSKLVGEIVQIRHSKTIAGIDEVRDETDKTGMRIAIDLKKDAKEEAILAYLMAKTELRTSYSANMVAIVDGRPKTIDLLSYCDCFIAHQVNVITRRSRYNLDKDNARLSIVNGLIKAADVIDEVIHIIRKSDDKADSQRNLEAAFGFSPDQSKAIVEMPLYKLSHTDVNTLINEKAALEADIAELTEILSNQDKLNSVIVKDLKQISKQFGDDRRTSIEEDNGETRDFNKRDLIAKEDVMLAATRDGYIKRSSMASWKGSGGQNGTLPGMKAGDTLIYNGQVETTDNMLFFTTKGNYLFVPVHSIQANKWLEEGVHVNTSVSLDANDKIIKGIAVKHFREDIYIAILTRNGSIKRVKLSDFKVVRYNRPIRAMRILGDDEVVDVAITSGNSNLMVLSVDGKAVMYNENEVSSSGTAAGGIKAAKFQGSPCVALLSFLPDESGKILLLTQYSHTRVLDVRNVQFTKRLGSTTVVFRSFKNEPHELVMAVKVDKKEAPITYKCTLLNGDYFDVTWPDLYLTPMEKYAKKPDDSKLQKKNYIVSANIAASDVISETTIALEPPVVEHPVTGNNDFEGGLEKPIVYAADGQADDIDRAEAKEPTERFEQISIFDDDF
ncbi:MAG: DNA topoisomerase IV subunit A [Bacilli bacterium]|nr:DNA topoisomerase IV subunit A [Bacilli bacterium]